jgi:hypothetical protein
MMHVSSISLLTTYPVFCRLNSLSTDQPRATGPILILYKCNRQRRLKQQRKLLPGSMVPLSLGEYLVAYVLAMLLTILPPPH